VRVVVTGAGGEIGGSVLTELVEHGHEVLAMTRRERAQPPAGVTWVRADLLDPRALPAALLGAQAIVHMAAVTHARRAREYMRVNVTGTEHLLAAAADVGVGRIVHVSTRAVGAQGGAYSHSKELAERAVAASSIPSVVLRPGEVYGGSSATDPILSLGAALRSRSWVPVLGDGSQMLAPVHVEDVAAVIARAVEQPNVEGKVYTLTGPEAITYAELIERLEMLLGLRPRRRISVPIALARVVIGTAGRLGVGSYVPDQVARLLLEKSVDRSAAERDFGFAPRTLEAGLAPLLAKPD
jgi:NADH dehydrogenase